MSVVVCQAQKAQLASTAAETGQYNAEHLDGDAPGIMQRGCQGNDEHAACRQSNKDEDTDAVWDQMDEVGGAQLGHERRYDIGEEHDALGDGGPDEIEGGGKHDDIEEIV